MPLFTSISYISVALSAKAAETEPGFAQRAYVSGVKIKEPLVFAGSFFRPEMRIARYYRLFVISRCSETHCLFFQSVNIWEFCWIICRIYAINIIWNLYSQ